MNKINKFSLASPLTSLNAKSILYAVASASAWHCSFILIASLRWPSKTSNSLWNTNNLSANNLNSVKSFKIIVF